MKYKLLYSPDAKDKLHDIKKQITISCGSELAIKTVSKIMKEIRKLQDNPEMGPSVEAMLGIPTSYRFLHISQNYIFYRINNTTVFITDIYNEREDFLWRMFGVNIRTIDSIKFWGE